MWNRITIVGCGLIGSSFALALKKSGSANRIAGWDSAPAVLDEALRLGIIDEVDHSFANGDCTSSDLIYLAMPVIEIIKFLKESSRRIKPGAVLTDAGSTKKEICQTAETHLAKEVSFVGGHPIAGSHQSGPANARGELFTGAPYVLIRENGDRAELSALHQTLESMGARVTFMTAAEHDRHVALLSHLPQLLSNALAATVKNTNVPISLAGTGYRDMTRLAASTWSMWHDILATNPRPIADALNQVIERLSSVRNELLEQSEHSRVALPVAQDLFEKN
ncbi:MAG TPA: prephenate dehydrogenase/arogenate dehydrogenase family protein [Pyrinomonadaceae bacterium]|nr:prephenate dehydrogenase/arogenate dehydrogenase family protein [Pyrinomonadaceae bacterium]